MVIGELADAELGSDRVLRAVAVFDERLPEWHGDLYFSGEWLTSGGGQGVNLASPASGTHRTVGRCVADIPLARTSQLQWLRGDYRDSVPRYSWQTSWRTHAPLVERALERHARASPSPIVGLPPRSSRWANGVRLVNGELHAPSPRYSSLAPEGDRRPRGPLEYRPCGPINSVR